VLSQVVDLVGMLYPIHRK